MAPSSSSSSSLIQDDLPTVHSLRYTNSLSERILLITKLVVGFAIITTLTLLLRSIFKYSWLILSSELAFEYCCYILLPTVLICTLKLLYNKRRACYYNTANRHETRQRIRPVRQSGITEQVISRLSWMARNGYI